MYLSYFPTIYLSCFYFNYLAVNKTLEKYSSDPLLPHYKRLIAQAEKDKMAEPTSLINTIKAFFWKKYRIFRRR